MLTDDVKATIVAALNKARQLAEIASDWNLDEVEIDGEMVDIYDLESEFATALAALEEPPMSEWQRSSGFIYRYPDGGGLAYADPDGQGRAQLRCLVDCEGDTKETVIILPDHLRIFERIQK